MPAKINAGTESDQIQCPAVQRHRLLDRQKCGIEGLSHRLSYAARIAVVHRYINDCSLYVRSSRILTPKCYQPKTCAADCEQSVRSGLSFELILIFRLQIDECIV